MNDIIIIKIKRSQEKMTLGSFFKNISNNLMIVPSIATYFLIDKYLVSFSSSEGSSMEPTIKSGDLIVVDRFFYKLFGGLKPDDIIVAVQPVDPSVNICKRIIQVGGNEVPNKPGIIVPQDFYWIEGDNSYKSYDSRHHGCVPANLIKGKVVWVLPM